MHSKADMTTRHVRLAVQKYNSQLYIKKIQYFNLTYRKERFYEISLYAPRLRRLREIDFYPKEPSGSLDDFA